MDFIPLTLLTEKGSEDKPVAPTKASSQVTYSFKEEKSNRRPASVIGTSTELMSELCLLMAVWPLSEKRPLPDREEGCNSFSRVYGPHHHRPYINPIKPKQPP